MTAKQPTSVTVEAYLVLEPKWSEWQRDEEGECVLAGGKVSRVTQKRPDVASGVVTKVRFKVDAGVFLPLRPEVEIHLHPGNTETVVVEAVDPREEES